jgi:hypothetical protein
MKNNSLSMQVIIKYISLVGDKCNSTFRLSLIADFFSGRHEWGL